MSEDTKKAPAIRFQGFTDDWEQRKLGDIAEIKTGPFGSTLHAEDYVQSGIPIITTEHFKSGHLPESKDGTPQVSDEDYSRLKSYILKKGDIVFSRVGSVDINALVTTLQDGWLFSGRVLRVRSQKQFDSDYLHYLLDTLPVKNDIISRAVGQTMPSINTEILKSTKLVLSKNIEEQKLIAGTLRKLDDTLALHQRNAALLKRLKEAYLKRMFPQNSENIPLLRFSDFSDPWEQRKFEDFAENFNYGLNASAMEFDGENKYIRITDIDEDSHRFIQSGLTSPNTDLLNADDYLLKEGDILFARTGASVGKSYQYEPQDGKVYYAGFLIRARIKPEFDSSFIFQNTLTEKYNNFIKITSQRSGQPGVNAQEYANLTIMVPSRGEQVKLGNFFKQLDYAIAPHQRKIEKLTEAKKVLLAKMFV
ncbi:hypothetical protein SDC9_97115 [bioreactor metagenome]|uniref:Type I restriction modification DNA specificity domain-containing protein n=1 Tax=bioreactor metagenome TaxID=1076179 RepID=A0A645ABR6_9ZZZZ